jgi:single-strand DNA-binding protein
MKNRVQLIGRVGQDPEVKHLEEKLATVSIATNDVLQRKRNKNKQSGTRVTKNRIKTADIIEGFVTKAEIGIETKLSHRTYEDKTAKSVMCMK